jgi:hypothetical protein
MSNRVVDAAHVVAFARMDGTLSALRRGSRTLAGVYTAALARMSCPEIWPSAQPCNDGLIGFGGGVVLRTLMASQYRLC